MTQVPSRRYRRATTNAVRIEPLESRILCSFTFPTNISSLLSNAGLGKPTVEQQWWLNNTGQAITNKVLGPATGKPGADVNAVKAWTITQGSKDVVIAVLDTGFDLNNSDLSSVLWTNSKEVAGDGIDNDGNGFVDDLHGWNFLNNNNNVQDNFVHGTAVASAIHSVAPGVSILPITIGTGAGANDQAVINGINYVIALKNAGVNVVAINASYISTSPTMVSQLPAIKAAGAAGILYAAAAGNLSLNLDTMFPGVSARQVARYLPSNLMFVAATDAQDNLASFSDYGGKSVAVAAPGVDMTLAIPGGIYAPLSGTSFAAPMVSAIAGLLESRFPNATMAQMKAAIMNSGDQVASLRGKTITGRRVDAYNALVYMGAKPPTPTPTPAPTPTPTNNLISTITTTISNTISNVISRYTSFRF